MKVFTTIAIVIAFLISDLNASPKINFNDLVINAEQNNLIREQAHSLAGSRSLPVTILTYEGIVIDAKGIENGEVVYAVITDKADIFHNGYTAFFNEINSGYDLTTSKLYFADGTVIDNTGGKFDPEVTDNSGVKEHLMITNWTEDNVYLFSKVNGDLIDPGFIPPTPSVLASPKMAMQHFNGNTILVSDQLSDGVFQFDTSGAYIGLFAPNGGINPDILNNIRGIRYRANNNLLVTVATGASTNTIQQFDTEGNHINTFIGSTNLLSPFDIMLRENDMLITNSSGTNKITRFDLEGNFLSNFYSGTNFSFPQQLHRLENGNILVAAFSTPSGLAILDSTGNFMRLLTGVTGLRSVFLLDNGNYLVTNGAGVHEIDSSSGSLIRTISSGTSFQFISEYTVDIPVSVGNSNLNFATDYRLEQNYPNPFNPSTSINYYIPEESNVTISITDVSGKLIRTIVNQNLTPGNYSVNFKGDNLASGIYYYSIEARNFKQTKKMILIK